MLQVKEIQFFVPHSLLQYKIKFCILFYVELYLLSIGSTLIKPVTKYGPPFFSKHEIVPAIFFKIIYMGTIIDIFFQSILLSAFKNQQKSRFYLHILSQETFYCKLSCLKFEHFIELYRDHIMCCSFPICQPISTFDAILESTYKAGF